ncbi:MAG: excisionase family DNA-binding protein [Pirellulales bacterium]
MEREPPLTIKQAAVALNLAHSTVRDLVECGKLRHYRVGPKGRTIRIGREHIDAYLESCVAALPQQHPATKRRRVVVTGMNPDLAAYLDQQS